MLPSVFLWALVTVSECASDKKFPPWFKFGSATSALQIEGAWNISGKTESKWDRLIHSFPYMFKDSNNDFACDSYHQWKRDLEMVSELGLQFYRFSISWPRLLPNGFPTVVNEEGKTYYNNLINGLLARGIEPIVTIHHFDLPQIFQDLGGWANPSIPDWFEDYARVVFSLFADRVKTWITINEPHIECDWYYGTVGVETPGLEDSLASYLCSKYMLMAHAKAWRLYEQEYKYKYNGKLSISNHLLWLNPLSPKDQNLTEIAREFIAGRFSHPIYSQEGGWPPVIQEIIEKASVKMGYSRSRLPSFTKEEIELVKGTYDFYAMNHYTTRLVRPRLPGEKLNKDILFVTALPEINAVFTSDPSWQYGYNTLMPINPVGMREQMHWLQKQYGDLEILISENGYSSTGPNLNDDERVAFIKAHLEQVLIAIDEGINVTGYTYWSLMDDFEYFDGYKQKVNIQSMISVDSPHGRYLRFTPYYMGPRRTEDMRPKIVVGKISKFGLYQVDFTDQMRKRTPRKSAHYYKNVIRQRSLTFPTPFLENK